MKSRLTLLVLFAFAGLLFSSCDDSEPTANSVTAPATYSFERNGISTVSFSGQTTRIQMGEELESGMLDFGKTETTLLEMFRNATATGGDANPFSSSALNSETKNIKSKVAASADFFASNATTAASIRADFESWISKQVSEVYPNRNTVATPGVAGQIADGSATRYVNAKGLEYNQAFVKSLIGGLMVDQILNNYLSPSVLDAGTKRDDNDAGTVESGESYTTMEHNWDEAFGYLYGTSQDITNPNATLGDDSFLNKYLGRVEGDADFAGIAQDIYNAFKLGRAAIVEKNYVVRDAQAQVIRQKISEIIGIRAVYYLEQGRLAFPTDRTQKSLFGTAFHDLSEGYGFIYSLQFTRKPNSGAPYFTKAEVDTMLSDLMGDGTNGLWDVEANTLSTMATQIAGRFDFDFDDAKE